MQFPNSQHPWTHSSGPDSAGARLRHSVGPRKLEQCGWYDSSLDLAQGLDVVEQDNDTLYQLWELSRS